jgi:hypothetical protein
MGRSALLSVPGTYYVSGRVRVLIAVEHDLLFVCVACGTRNHFARDAGLELETRPRALRLLVPPQR